MCVTTPDDTDHSRAGCSSQAPTTSRNGPPHASGRSSASGELYVLTAGRASYQIGPDARATHLADNRFLGTLRLEAGSPLCPLRAQFLLLVPEPDDLTLTESEAHDS